MKYMYVPLRRGCPLACVQKLLITPVLFPFGAFARAIDTTSALHRLRNTVGLARVDGFASLLDLLQNGCVVQVLLGCDGCGLALEGDVEVLDAIELLKHALHGAGAAAAGHGDVELVVVFGHFEECFGVVGVGSR